ncbi:hypothetical protein AB0K43_29890 [Kitasatospora sp. NPDC049258]|uniref:hypothetical protein n=1 Tax=Kitasatospora sp. NPDC049258 TaxID=3155394 RepID=UPI003412DEF3
MAEYTSGGVTRTVRPPGSTPSRAAVPRMRETPHGDTLAGLGIAPGDDGAVGRL